MVASEIRGKTLQQLDEAFLKMTSAEWDLALVGKSQEEVTEAAKALLLVQRARLRLGNAELSDIRKKLVENEKGLEEGRLQMMKVLETFEKIEVALDAITSFLGIVARVVSLI